MSRLKTFGKYLLMFVAFYIFVTVMSIGFIKGTYDTMEQNVYSSEEIQIEVDEAKSTFVNGYVKGKLTNNTDSDIHSKYVKINFLSKKGNVILTKYLDIDELKAKETKNFTINFEAENIKSFNMSVTDEYVQEKSDVQLINLEDAEKAAKSFLSKGVKYSIITLGEKGAALVSNERSVIVPAYKVKAVDTTAAGDSFIGAFLFKLLENEVNLDGIDKLSCDTIRDYLLFANHYAAYSTTKKGAIASYANLEEIQEYIKNR